MLKENKKKSFKENFIRLAGISLALVAIVFAGTPAFQLIPELLREQICLFHHSVPSCPSSKFRSLDGSCNNKAHPLWGTQYSKYNRLLPALYGDGVSSFQKSVTGNSLASARKVSKIVFGEKSVPDIRYSLVMMQYGQFIAHDMSNGLDTEAPPCCSGEAGQFLVDVPYCAAIEIPKDDPAYPSNLTCLNFHRNANTGDLGCPKLAAGEAVDQIIAVTSYLDLSLVYGNSDSQSKSIRTLSGGRLIMRQKDGHEYPPQDPDATTNCFVDSPNETCYLGGDSRLNQSPHLTIVHILFIREHNRLADGLAAVNPHWSDERIFQEARRINIAEHQYIAYYEWLPIFLGRENMIKHGIIYNVAEDEYVNDYNASVESTVFNEQGNSAFRFFHSQIEGHLNLVSESRDTISTIAISDHLNNPNITQDNFDDLARGMVQQFSQLADDQFDTQIREFLFKHKDIFGSDLRSIDIQRGRDHGIGRYNDYRQFCGLPRATKWDDYLDLIPASKLANLKAVYENFEDVELSVGALLENHIDNTTLAGPTFLCIFNIQFLTTRVSDRFWFESSDPEVAFTREQLVEIRRSSFARIFCDNSNNVTTVQKQAFDAVDAESNPIVSCSEIPVVDLTKWQESSQ